MIVLPFASSCRKQYDVVVQGRIIFKDSKLPVKNDKFIYCLAKKKVLSTECRPEYFYTDDNGKFSFVAQAEKGKSIRIEHKSGVGNYFWYGDFDKNNLTIDAGTIEIINND